MQYNREIKIDNIRHFHFIGIGGIGMSGIAALMIGLGYRITGSDAAKTEITLALERIGAKITEGHRKNLPKGTQAIVVSSAIRDDNPEILAAKKAGLPIIHRAFMLSQLARLKKTITVAGTHGKTTTTSMMAAAFESCGAGATAVVGGILKNAGSNIKMGGGEYFIAEADESDGSFLDFRPLATCVTNIDADHLDHYGSLDGIKAAFIRHIFTVPFFGIAALCTDDEGVRSILPYIPGPYLSCGINKGADWQAKNVSFSENGTGYEAWFKGRKKGLVRLQCCGMHNVRNSLLVLAVGCYLGFPFEKLAEGLSNFRGVKRRLDRLGSAGGVDFMDDYGHHPTEIMATLAAAREMFKGRRLTVVFQPHRYTRTRDLYREFGMAFGNADKLFIAPIYSAGETPIKGISSDLIIKSARKNGINARPFPGVLQMIKELAPGDVLITLGAGDIWKTGMEIRFKMEMLGMEFGNSNSMSS